MSGYSWTLPTPTDPATTVAEEQKELLLGKDIKFDGDFSVNAAGDYVLLSVPVSLSCVLSMELGFRVSSRKESATLNSRLLKGRLSTNSVSKSA
jgi:hypothetical protein